MTSGGIALLLCGAGGSGKSSLVAGLALQRKTPLGDDAVHLDREAGRVRPFKRLLKVHEPARSLLGLPEGAPELRALWPDAHHYRPSDLGAAWADPAPVAVVVFPRRQEGDPARLLPLPPSEGMRRVMEQVVLVRRAGPAEFDALAAVLANARFLELPFGELREGIQALQDLLPGQAP